MPEHSSGLRAAFHHPALLASGAAAFSLSTLLSALKPVLVARLAEEAGVREGMAGLTAAMPFIGLALSSLLFYLRPPVSDVRSLAWRFGVLLVAAELLSAWLFAQTALLLTLQFTAGFSIGALMAATSRIIAVSAAPDESFGVVDMTAVALMSLMIAGAGRAVSAAGLTGVYLFAALVSLLLAIVVGIYREGEAEHRHHARSGALPALSRKPAAVIVMGMVFITCSGFGFAFLFSLAARLGMDYAVAGDRLGLLLFLSASACLVGGWFSGRFGPRFPLLGAFLACAFGWWVAVAATSVTVFFLALVPAIFALQFNFPILLALAGSLDEHGRWAGVGVPLITSGFAWAAVLAGWIVERFGLDALGSATAMGIALCLLLLWPATSPRG